MHCMDLMETHKKRVVDWVLAKLQSPSLGTPSVRAKRGPKPGTKRGRHRRKPGIKSAIEPTGAKRGPKPGSKRGRKPGKKG